MFCHVWLDENTLLFWNMYLYLGKGFESRAMAVRSDVLYTVSSWGRYFVNWGLVIGKIPSSPTFLKKCNQIWTIVSILITHYYNSSGAFSALGTQQCTISSSSNADTVAARTLLHRFIWLARLPLRLRSLWISLETPLYLSHGRRLRQLCAPLLVTPASLLEA